MARQGERLLAASTATIDDEPVTSADAQYCLGEYFRELSERFEAGFDPGLSPTEAELRAPRGAFVVVRLGGRPVGCGGFKYMPPDGAYLKRMWIDGSARGLGLGKRLLQALEDRARSCGYRVALLETNKVLAEAQRLYRACGYREVVPFNDEPYAHHWFEKPLT